MIQVNVTGHIRREKLFNKRLTKPNTSEEEIYRLLLNRFKNNGKTTKDINQKTAPY